MTTSSVIASPDKTVTWPPVSVVLPVYNGEKVIAACIDSLLSQDYPVDLREIVIVNNASSDGTVGLLDRYRDRVSILDETGRGVSRARNCGIAAAKYDFIAFIDADCVADTGWLTALIRPFINDETLSVVGGRILALPGANYVERFGEEIHDHQKAIEVYRPHYVITMNIAIRKSVFDDIGLFDPLFLRAQDADLSFRLDLAGHRLSYAADAVIHHHNESTLRGLFREGFKHGMWQICLYRKYSDTLTKNRRRFNSAEYKRLFGYLGNSLASVRKPASIRTDAFCQLIFNAGKKLGHIVGSVRFKHMAL